MISQAQIEYQNNTIIGVWVLLNLIWLVRLSISLFKNILYKKDKWRHSDFLLTVDVVMLFLWAILIIIKAGSIIGNNILKP